MVKCALLACGLLLMLAPCAVAQTTSGLADSSGPYGQHITGSLQVDGPIKGDISGTSVTATGGTTVRTQADWMAGLDKDSGYGTLFIGLPPNISPVETPELLGGIAGAGGTLVCKSVISTNVGCNIAMQGTGGLMVGNGSGAAFATLDPGGLVSGYATLTPGTAGATYVNTVILNAVSPTGVVTHWQINAASGGVGIGVNNKAQQNGCVALGITSQCFGFASIVTGNGAYDYSSYGVNCHQSQGISGGAGTNQICEQTLLASISNATATRLTVDGTTNVAQSRSVPVQSIGHGTFKIEVECTKTTTGESVAWFVAGQFVRAVNPIALLNVTGAGAASSGGGSLATATLSVTADTTNENLNITVTPPNGNSALIGCDAIARWMERIS